MRRLARRQQGKQHRQSGAQLRSVAKGFQHRARDAARSCRCPASSTGTSIISWCWKAFDGDRVYINDPAIGRRRIDMAELDLAFTGVVLTMERTEAFRKIGSEAAGDCGCCCASCATRRRRLACWWCVSFALVVPSIVAAGFSKIFVDDILIRHTAQLARSAADRHGHDRGLPRHPDRWCASRCCCGCRPSSRWS